MQKCVSIEKVNLVEVSNLELEVETKLEQEELIEMINCLSQNQKQVVILKFIGGLDNREIGEITGKKEGAIRILQMRALAGLRQKLIKEDYGSGS